MRILDSFLHIESFNTNNAWGFGGFIGKVYENKVKKLKIRKGRACYRHLPYQPFERYYFDGKEIDKKEFLSKLNQQG